MASHTWHLPLWNVVPIGELIARGSRAYGKAQALFCLIHFVLAFRALELVKELWMFATQKVWPSCLKRSRPSTASKARRTIRGSDTSVHSGQLAI